MLQVASTGDVVYALPEDFQATLRARSWWLRAQPALQQVPSRTRPCQQSHHRCHSAVLSHKTQCAHHSPQPRLIARARLQVAAAAQYLVRVTFGTALITSVLLVWFTIVAILTSSQSSDSDRRRAPASPGLPPAPAALPCLRTDSNGTLAVLSRLSTLWQLPGFSCRATVCAFVQTSLQTSWTARSLSPVGAGEADDGTLLLTSRRRNNSGYGGGGGMRMWFDPTDILWYWDPFYGRRRRERRMRGEGMSFVESIFSFVFGDGDPNAEFEERRWQMVRSCGRRLIPLCNTHAQQALC